MKQIKKTFTLLLAVLLVVSVMPLTASATAGDPITGITIASPDLTGTTTIASAAFGTPATNIDLTGAPVPVVTPGTATLPAKPGKNIIESVTISKTGGEGSDTAKFFVLPTGKKVDNMTGAQIQAATAFVDGTDYLSDGDTIVVVVGVGTVADFALSTNVDVYAIKVTVTSGATGNIGGEASVKAPVLKVQVPLDVDFALNPMQVGEVSGDSQVTAIDYPIVNVSEAPVKVSFALTAEVDSDVTLVTDKTVLKPTVVAERTKKMYFGALSADATSAATGASPTGFNYDPTKLTTLRLFTPDDASVGTDGDVEFEFLLKAGAALNTPTADKTGVASFQFYAVLNSYAPWDAGDLAVTGTYNLTGVRNLDYAAAATSDIAADSLNLLKVVPQYSTAGFIENGTTVVTRTDPVPASYSSNTDVEIPFAFLTKEVTAIINTSNNGSLASSFEYDYDNNKIILLQNAGATASVWNANIPTGSYPVKITLDDATEYTFTVAFTNP